MSVVVSMSAFWAVCGWLFAQIMFPELPHMVPITISLIHITHVAYFAIADWRASRTIP